MKLLLKMMTSFLFAASSMAHPLYNTLGGDWVGSGFVNYGGSDVASTTYTLSIDKNGIFRDHRIDVDSNGELIQEFRIAVEYTATLGASKLEGKVTQGNDSILSHANGYCLVDECSFIYSWTTGDLAHVNVRKIDADHIVVNKQVISANADIFYYMQSRLTRVK